MSVWMWIGVGVGAMLALSAVVSLALGAILRRIGREIGEIVETEPWGVSPSSHAERRRGRRRAGGHA